MKNVQKKACLILFTALFQLVPSFIFSQKTNVGAKRVSFVLSNPSLSAKELEIQYFDPTTKKTSGYGLHLGPLQTHADNKPVGTRVYLKKGQELQLAFVLADSDDGRKFNMNKVFKISAAQREQATIDEQNEQKAAFENPDEDNDMAAFAQRHGLTMVNIRVSGKSILKKQVHLRAQLPLVEKRTNNGFSRKLSSSSQVIMSYPVGTKIYRCDGPYWNGDTVKETLLLTIESDLQDYSIRI